MTRAHAAALLLALAAACGRGNGEVLGPRGVGERTRIAAAADPVLVSAIGDTLPLEVPVRVEALGDGTPLAGSEVRFEVRRGGGVLVGSSASTDADGRSAVLLVPDGGTDTTVVRASVLDDPEAAIDVAHVPRPVFTAPADPGAVAIVPGASSGVLLTLPGSAAADLLVFSTSRERAGLEFELRRGFGVQTVPAARGVAAAPLRPATPALAPDAATVSVTDSPILSGSPLPSALDTYNCRTPEHGRAPLVWLSRGLALYLDEAAAPDSARLREIARAYDEEVAPRVFALFGAPVDLDGNGRLIAVMTPAMDAGVYCASVHLLGREIVYLPWQPSRTVGEDVGALAHELQHVINASHHYRSGGTGARSEPSWLNEGMSLVAEWHSGFPAEPLRRALAWLPRANGGLPLLAAGYDVHHLGGWFLFALYLGDRFGPGTYRRLGTSGLVGQRNVERVTGVPFRDLLRDWFLALALSDDPPDDPAWRLTAIDVGGEEERIAACGCMGAERLPGLDREELPTVGPLRILRTLQVQDAYFFRLARRGRDVTFYFQAGGNPDVELVVLPRR